MLVRVSAFVCVFSLFHAGTRRERGYNTCPPPPPHMAGAEEGSDVESARFLPSGAVTHLCINCISSSFCQQSATHLVRFSTHTHTHAHTGNICVCVCVGWGEGNQKPKRPCAHSKYKPSKGLAKSSTSFFYFFLSLSYFVCSKLDLGCGVAARWCRRVRLHCLPGGGARNHTKPPFKAALTANAASRIGYVAINTLNYGIGFASGGGREEHGPKYT